MTNEKDILNMEIRKATASDIEKLTELRIEFLAEANNIKDNELNTIGLSCIHLIKQ